MTIHCSSIITDYLNLLKQNFTIVETDDGCRIVTPIHRPDGEAIEVVVQRLADDKVRFSDEFSTADYLFLNGLTLEGNKKLQDEAARIAKLRGVQLVHSELFVDVDAGSEADALRRLLDAIEALTYFIYRRSHREARSFLEEVELYLAENSVTFHGDYSLRGQTIEHTVPIYVNSAKNLVISPLSSTSAANARHRVKELAFVVQDVKLVQPRVRFSAILDDRTTIGKRVWEDGIVNKVLSTQLDQVVRWEGRQQLLRLAR